jgi:hypothetical protein
MFHVKQYGTQDLRALVVIQARLLLRTPGFAVLALGLGVLGAILGALPQRFASPDDALFAASAVIAWTAPTAAILLVCVVSAGATSGLHQIWTSTRRASAVAYACGTLHLLFLLICSALVSASFAFCRLAAWLVELLGLRGSMGWGWTSLAHALRDALALAALALPPVVALVIARIPTLIRALLAALGLASAAHLAEVYEPRSEVHALLLITTFVLWSVGWCCVTALLQRRDREADDTD